MRCLERDPDKRPASALGVAAALPGGDPLAAALAMGETPSPEMVAAAPKEGTLRPAVAVACLAGLLACLAFVVTLSGRVTLHGLVPLDKPPDVLRDRAGEILRKLGYADAPADEAYGFAHRPEYLRHVAEHDRSPARWDGLRSGRPAAISFWYRRSPYYLAPLSPAPFVELHDPPGALSGMASLILDMQGRLIRFEIVPPQIEERPAAAGEPEWQTLFAEAGLDPAGFAPADPKWVPPFSNDVRRAWEGTYPGQPETPIRVEAAGLRGRPVYFQIVEPWTAPERMRYGGPQGANWPFQILVMVLVLATMTAGVLLAHRNLRSGLGDRKGAFRLAVFVFTTSQLGWAVAFGHVPTFDEFTALLKSLSVRLLFAGFLWLLYVSLEPYVRRRWPHRIISWSRLLAGGWRDPLVGRDLLVGGLSGVASATLSFSTQLVPGWLGLPPETPVVTDYYKLLGLRRVIGTFLGNSILQMVFVGLGILFLLLLFNILLRREWLAAGALWLLLSLMVVAGTDNPLAMLPFVALWAAVFVFILTRVGLLAFVSYLFFHTLCDAYPLTHNLSAWYAESTLFVLAVTVSLALYGFYTSLGGQRLLGDGLIKGGD